jgi:hypothetical protein
MARNVVVWLDPTTDEDHRNLEKVVPDGTTTKPIDSVFSAFPSLDTLFSREWFTRRWVLQEVVLSRLLTTQYGFGKFTWESLNHCADVHLDHQHGFH